ncbi:hypothetical protein PsorP6_017712 [Peronosclerospora sorghi]|uniref:Uncharacterized protein n=1 Tax=Peronosclerospora sorghi TaxID=230839 RepID=A0ACC0WL48_9STRA|nr:hypothetical protein PsorP6_017712 [Peronosclerospora sorghi]
MARDKHVDSLIQDAMTLDTSTLGLSSARIGRVKWVANEKPHLDAHTRSRPRAKKKKTRQQDKCITIRRESCEDKRSREEDRDRACVERIRTQPSTTLARPCALVSTLRRHVGVCQPTG